MPLQSLLHGEFTPVMILPPRYLDKAFLEGTTHVLDRRMSEVQSHDAHRRYRQSEGYQMLEMRPCFQTGRYCESPRLVEARRSKGGHPADEKIQTGVGRQADQDAIKEDD